MKIGRNAILLFLTSVALAADFQVSASLDRSQVALNEQAILSLTISGTGDLPQPQLPGLTGFQIYNAGRSQNYTWINGKAAASSTYNYVLTPMSEGRFVIPSIRIESQGMAAQTEPLALEVVKGDAAAASPGTAREEGTARPAAGAHGPAAVFITGTVDKTSVYVGEPLIYTFRLYNRVPLLSRPGYQPPEMTGFWTEDLPPQRNYTSSVKGMPYNVTEIQTALFPSAPGKARVGSASLTVNLENVGSDPFGGDFFSQFFGRAEQKILRTDPVTITVRPLPEPKPADFKGAVGQYSLTAQTDKERISVGAPLTLTLTVSGRGNIKSLPDLTIPPLTNFRTFDANAATSIEKKDGQVSGSKVFKTVLIPTASGELTIPPVPFVFFDITSRQYRTIRSRPITVHVAPGVAGASSWGQTPMSTGGQTPAVVQMASPGIKFLGEDIRYIRTPGTIASQGEPLYKRAWVLWLHGLLLGGLCLGGLARLYYQFFLADRVLYRYRKAREKALAAIGRTSEFLAANNIKSAGNHLADVLQDYLAAKLGIEDRSAALRDVVERLKSRGLTPHTGEKVRNIWETFDLYQFAPAQVQASEVRASMETLKHVIEEVEKEVQWEN